MFKVKRVVGIGLSKKNLRFAIKDSKRAGYKNIEAIPYQKENKTYYNILAN